MGKGSRERTNRVVDREINPERYKEKKGLSKKATVIIAILCAVAVAATATVFIVINALNSEEKQIHSTVSLSSANYEIDNAKLSFYFNTVYHNFTSNYSSNLSSMGLNTSSSLKTQTCYYDSTQSWYDYFMNSAISEAQQVLYCLEAAKADGYTLTDEDNSTIADSLSSIVNAAKAKGVNNNEYVASLYGAGVTYDDVKECLEWSTLSTNYRNDYINSIDPTEAELEAYYNENREALDTVSVMAYSYGAEYADDADDDTIAAAIAESLAKGEALENAGSADAFRAIVRQAIVDDYAAQGSNASDSDIDTTLGQCVKTDATKSVLTNAGVSDDDASWMLSTERKVGDTKSVRDESTGNCTVYMLVSVAERQDYATKSVRHILFTSDTYGSADSAYSQAKTVLYQWKKDGRGEDEFAALASQYSEDTGSVSTGGLYENIKKGDMVAAFENWAFDSSRVEGDSGIVQSDYGYHIMYFVGDGDIAWRAAANDALTSEKYNDYLAGLAEKYPVKTNNENAYKIVG